MDQVKLAKTESLFRHVNERIAETAERFEADEVTVVCECSDSGCTERIDAPLVEYERVRAEPAQFLLAGGHQDKRIERTVRAARGYRIVEKLGLAGQIARSLDPRAKPA